ncbi:NMDA receptor-regulated protein (macronuclear) [Tetrahymena thermophila SB210]|uniref:NMDA receptor-regulated protein n=1 Tax=Tetrahymena thermophila (strain SB210) TaxID=312017 RepID=I7MKT8_TETTS|nr:NMDA receptor-regulated protein [Tetrahymena thermophila SB210]EAS00294.2 NMDA receptor-regulated protein [Tetrahymena thermophila SB210]|eukprot:XP_001020539.2 NMDA receptor-regulated protein [Tetrahymena thermophila SB210]
MLKGAIDSLDSKQAALFKNLVKFYETKQYKKGLKQADKLLEQKPNHAESMAMKAIFLYFTGQKSEGLDLSKKALMKNLKSDIAWHIHGIINRTNRNYQEAINCYKKALDISPDNVQILRDLALLQVQIRDVEGLCDTRKKLLLNKESLIINWVAYAFSLHLKGSIEECLKVIDSIINITKNNPLKGIEKTEFCLYHAQVYADGGNYEMQLKILEQNEEGILDKVALNEQRIKAYLKLNKQDQAIQCIEKLIEINPQNRNYFNLLKQARGLPEIPANEEERLKIVSFFEEIGAKYNSNIISYMALDFSKGQDFENKLIKYITPYFRKGIPSLFSELKHLYQDNEKVQIIEKVLLNNLASLQKESKFPNSDAIESPCCLLWNYMLLAQHFDRVNQLTKALEYVNLAINHTPTLIELYLVKAKIYKHQFNHKVAFENADKARTMDLADRYLNNKAIKYALRCGFFDQANDLLRLFLKDPSEGNPFELQTLWYEIAQGETLLKKGEYARALRMFKFVQKAFIDIYEDQFDFHTYCIRKYNLNTYTNLLNYENGVYNQKPFIYGSTLLVQSLMEYITVRLVEIKKKEEEELRIKNMTQMEKKKWKKQQEIEAEKAAKDPNVEFRKKHDLDGEEFRNSQPLVEANHVAKQLIHTKVSNPQLKFKSSYVLVDFYIETNRPLLLIKALNKVISSNHCANGIHLAKLKAAIYLEKFLKGDKLNEHVKKYSEEALHNILNGKTIEQFNTEYISKNTSSNGCYKNALHALKCDIVLGKANKEQLLKFHEDLLMNRNDLTLQQATQLFDEFIKLNDFNYKNEVSEKLQKQFPESEYYFGKYRFDEKTHLELAQQQQQQDSNKK